MWLKLKVGENQQNGMGAPFFLDVNSEDSDQIRPIPRMVCVFAGRTGHFVGFDLLLF